MTVIDSRPGTDPASTWVVGEPRLLAGLHEHDRVDFTTHRRLHGDVSRLDRQEYERRCEAVDLRGRGGAAFPVAAKLRSLPRRGAPVVVVNGSESEPASFKDRTLMRRVPHLVLDGALGIGAAIRARRVVVAVHDKASAESLRWAVAERPDSARVDIQETAGSFVAGEARAVVRSLEGGPAAPPGRRTPPTIRGIHGRPTFVSNAETYAQLAVLGHRGAHAPGYHQRGQDRSQLATDRYRDDRADGGTHSDLVELKIGLGGEDRPRESPCDHDDDLRAQTNLDDLLEEQAPPNPMGEGRADRFHRQHHHVADIDRERNRPAAQRAQ